MKSIQIKSLEELDQAAKEFLEVTKGYKVFAFDAPMGTGKTTLITAICRALGVDEVVNSPTFAIVNEYAIPTAEKYLYHMDCYRLNNLEEGLNLGFVDYVTSGAYCFIEWPDIVAPLLPEDTLHVRICEEKDKTRTISFFQGEE